jgi:hypothetical protein
LQLLTQLLVPALSFAVTKNQLAVAQYLLAQIEPIMGEVALAFGFSSNFSIFRARCLFCVFFSHFRFRFFFLFLWCDLQAMAQSFIQLQNTLNSANANNHNADQAEQTEDLEHRIIDRQNRDNNNVQNVHRISVKMSQLLRHFIGRKQMHEVIKGIHPRLGANSPLRMLNRDVICLIRQHLFD